MRAVVCQGFACAERGFSLQRHFGHTWKSRRTLKTNGYVGPGARDVGGAGGQSVAKGAHLFVVHDTQRRRHDDVTELTRGQQVVGPLLDAHERNVEARGDNTALVDAPNELNHDLPAAVVVDDLELPNVS